MGIFVLKLYADTINKARAVFFYRGASQGFLNPLSLRSLVESCIFPVLMYGSESWVVNVQETGVFSSRDWETHLAAPQVQHPTARA